MGRRPIVLEKEERTYMSEKRKAVRKPVLVTTVIRKAAPAGKDAAGGYEIMEFRTRDLSTGGIFLSTEDLSIFDLGDEVEILVDDSGARYYEGKARVVRSARTFSGEGNPVESGYGLMFLSPDGEFNGMLARKLKD
jgi:hypothetical protein